MKENKRYTKSEKTRQYIIEKVAPIFNTKGFAGTSLFDLTEATGLTKGAIYGNFKNKDEIAAEAFKYNYSLLAGIFGAEMALATTAIEKLRLLPSIYRKIYVKIMSMGGCPILNTIADSDDAHETLKELSAKSLKTSKKSLEQIIIEGIRNNEIKPDTNADRISALILTLVEGGILIAKTMNNDAYFEESVQQIKNIVDNISS